jgi:endoglucanase
MKKTFCFIIIISLFSCGFAQDFLHVDNKKIVNGNGQTVLLRGIGLGGWMVQEGYMMQTSSFATAQYQIKAKIEAVIGAEKTADFYEAWLDNYIQKVDVDSLKAWGFNSIRLPMHYNLYTLPIEQEPVKGENTWLEKGFLLTDQLLQWCAANEMYLILDLHATPGGQGKESAISDYNPGKPSLWENADNRAKTVALWKKLAERYANESWIGGYDLINETNWTMTNNKPLKDLYVAITNAIRDVDKDHIIFIEGNWFANDFTGLTPPWDKNMVYSFHKYWSYNDQGSIQWMLDIRNTHNIPIWCGESGENSNAWFTDAIKLLELNNIGWAWWPCKKIESISGPLSIPQSNGYDRLLQYWGGTATKPSIDFATTAMMELAENLKLRNCIFQKDVIDAMFRQAKTTLTMPFVEHAAPGLIFATDYDLGTYGYAYVDEEAADYHVSTNTYTSWNNGWMYRNDGVDIEACSDNGPANGYNIGWIGTDEWLSYTVDIDETAAYDVKFRIAAQSASGRMHIELDNRPVSTVISIKNTGGYQNWSTVTARGIILEQGRHILKLYFDAAGFNLNFVQFDNPTPIHEQSFVCLAASIRQDGYAITASLNKKLSSLLPLAPAGFSVRIIDKNIKINSYEIDSSGYQVVLSLNEQVFYKDRVVLSYTGDVVKAIDETILTPFTDLSVINRLETRYDIPGQIQAENYDINNGFVLESTTDTDAGQDLGYSDVGDYADYLVTVQNSGTFNVEYRIASESNGGRVDLILLDDDDSQKIHSVTFPATGGWQKWQTVTQSAVLKEGHYTLRVKVTKSGFNFNWMRFVFVTVVEKNTIKPTGFKLEQNYPNPFNPATTIPYFIGRQSQVDISIFNSQGQWIQTLIHEMKTPGEYSIAWDGRMVTGQPAASGVYFCRLAADDFLLTRKMILMH